MGDEICDKRKSSPGQRDLGSAYTNTIMAHKASVDGGSQETFDLEAIKGSIMTTKEAVLGPFETH